MIRPDRWGALRTRCSRPPPDRETADEQNQGRQTAASVTDEGLRRGDLTTINIDTSESIAIDASTLGRENAILPNEASASVSFAAPVEQTEVQELTGDALDESAVMLEVEAIDSTWVRVSSDGGVAFQGILAPGLKRRWVARESFLVRSGRAHGARYWLQGDLLGNGRLGVATKVLRFRADSEGITLLGPELEPLSLTPLTSDAAER